MQMCMVVFEHARLSNLILLERAARSSSGRMLMQTWPALHDALLAHELGRETRWRRCASE
jgi:hypothetical protein